ncbi:von Hippel-Lindau disease tumor suppressor protein [Mycena sanguinolenta]|uniref:von Hippel-Lindau disease tumor suppressor protein n=1 Tax=Mycena sanguinolenta TaxID=230812 RepID=A0A8H7CWJ9_9AGAR|nr:von Hippel-Lindau disease tumor suppressor protein [Mycena sanguinolenta]
MTILKKAPRLFPIPHNRDISDLKSIDHDTATVVNFINQATETAEVFWIDYAGARQKYWVLEPGQKYRQETYVTHPWEVVFGGEKVHYLPSSAGEFDVIIGSTENPALTPLQTCDGGVDTAINFVNWAAEVAVISLIKSDGTREAKVTLHPEEESHQHTMVNCLWEVAIDGKATLYLATDTDSDVFIG